MSERSTDPADPTLTIGQRVQFWRQRRGMNRDALGELVGKSGRWVRAVESGQIKQPKLTLLIQLAEALRVKDLAQLTGGLSIPVSVFRGPGHPALAAVRDAINAVAVSADGAPPPLDHLEARLAAAWRARHASPDHRTVLGSLLPEMIRDAKYAVRAYEGADRRRAYAVLAGVYNLAQFFVAYQPSTDLLWRIVERSIMAAEESEDPLALGGAVWLAVQAHRDAGDFDAAEEVNRQGLEQLEPAVADGSDRMRAMWGALQYEAAYTAARAGEQGTAWRWWDEANATAQTLPVTYYDAMTSFSRGIMGAHAVTTAVELKLPGEAVRQARDSMRHPIPSQPRRGRHLIEVARAYELNRDGRGELETLKDAYVTAPETIRFNGYARRMVLDLTDGPKSLRGDARDLADRIGILV